MLCRAGLYSSNPSKGTMAPLTSPLSAARCAALTAVLLLVTAVFAPITYAQAPPAKERHTILVRPQGNTCVYQIADQTNQDVFIVRPNGAVVVRAQNGLWADVTVEDAEVRGANGPRSVPGVQNSRRGFTLRPEASQVAFQDAFNVRSSIAEGTSTEHRVRIRCCPERGRGQECPAWQDAQPYSPMSQDGGGGSASLLPFNHSNLARGPMAAPPAPPTPLPPGGPVMRVEEEN